MAVIQQPELMGLKLDTPVQFVPGVGPVRAKLFNKLGVYTVQDLLEYFPYAWEFGPDDAAIRQRLVEVLKYKNERMKNVFSRTEKKHS